MPCIWGQHNSVQLFCPVVILPPNPTPATAGGHVGVQALIDTGATTTAITTALAARLSLQPIGIMPIHGVGGVQHHNSHLFQVGFPFAPYPPPQQGQVPGTIFVLQKLIQGCSFQAGSAPFEVLLGMDVISIGSLVVQGNGTFSFSF
jgi:hypothetical protein